MSYTPPRELLRGLSYDKASLLGMPQVNARYTGNTTKSYERMDGSLCPICGRPTTNVHHAPSRAITQTRHGFLLRPALIALCGSGTTGCHGRFHAGDLTLSWVWDRDEFAEKWWTGELFAQGIKPHANELYLLGGWLLEEHSTNTQIRIRK